jgi:hypothetical protein
MKMVAQLTYAGTVCSKFCANIMTNSKKTFKFKIGVLWATITQKRKKSDDFILPLTRHSD